VRYFLYSWNLKLPYYHHKNSQILLSAISLKFIFCVPRIHCIPIFPSSSSLQGVSCPKCVCMSCFPIRVTYFSHLNPVYLVDFIIWFSPHSCYFMFV
jgi:hypothetical protein